MGLSSKTKKKVFTKKKLSILIVLVLALGAVGYFYVLPKFEKTEVVAVTTTESTAEQGDLNITFEGDGTVSIPITYLDFEVEGRLTKIYVQGGQSFKKGDLIAEVNDEDYVKSVSKAQIAYDKADLSLQNTIKQRELSDISEKQQLSTLKTTMQDKEKDMNEMAQKYSTVQVSIKDYDDSKTAYKNAKDAYELQVKKVQVSSNNIDITNSRLALKDAKESLDTAKETLAKTKLVAEMDGKIINISKDEGDTVNPSTTSSSTSSKSSSSSSDHFISFVCSNKVNVKSSISEGDVKTVLVGQQVQVKLEEGVGDDIFKGAVTEIKNLPTTDSSGIVTYEAWSQFESDNQNIKDGMTCTITYIIKGKENVVYILNKAVNSEDGVQYVEIKDKSGQITKKTVTTGFSDGEKVEVISGLSKGETVVIRGDRS